MSKNRVETPQCVEVTSSVMLKGDGHDLLLSLDFPFA